ncbi:MAG: VWA domain-containing protein [Candidatus Zambryskibacteria bacterium]|nr:VWA domain-containing protein [Candidatus Zambryskibacteria bacterium]
MRLLLCAVLTGLLLVSRVTAQQEQQRFRAETELVEVNVLVTDKNGEVVRGLTKDDFTVLDEGKPQQISNFSFVEIPFSNSGSAELAMTVTESGIDVKAESLGRIYIMVLDDLHTTSCVDDRLECEVASAWIDVKKRARLFIEKFFSNNDLMAVVYTSEISGLGQDLTNDRALLLKVLEGFSGRRPNDPPVGRKVEATLAERRSNDLHMLRQVQDLANWSEKNLPARQKVVLLFSEGIENWAGIPQTDTSNVALSPSARARASSDASRAVPREDSIMLDRMRETVAVAVGANLSIVSVDARGLGAPDDGHQSLRILSEGTGTRPILRTNEFEQAFERLVREHSLYYLVGYTMPLGVKQGETRRITMKVNRRGVEMRYRQAYVVPASLRD